MIPLLAVIQGVGSILDNLVTTEEEKAKIALQSKALDVSLLQGQIDVNKEEAKHGSLFVAGWRPAAGWIAAVALGVTFIPKALVQTGIWTYQAIVIVSQWDGSGAPPVTPDFPDLGVTDLIGLLLAMLGLGAMRSFDKVRHVDTKAVESTRR
jgi:hypothetical protein